MQPFLQLVAHDLYTKIGNDLSRTVLVFPNKRANLFFNEYLAEESDQPIWSPAAMSISDLLQKLSVQKAGDPIRLVCELYKVFKEEIESRETLDDFYFWGELLISDFDDVDKNMVDADKLFSNLQDLKNLMDDYEFLDEEQEEAIRQFFQNFSIERRTELKEKFISLWDKLGIIYHRYRENLAELGIAYEGMLYRNVIEQLDTDRLKYDKYVFVGFNVLNKVEKEFFQKLQKAGKAMFYWDYDLFYTQRISKHEAGEFIKRNLIDFPNELPESYFDIFRKPKKIRYISASTENAQARFLPEWVKATQTHTTQIVSEKGKRHRALQRSPAPPRASLHPTGCAKRKYHYGIPIGANSGVQLHQRSYGITDQRLSTGYRTFHLRSRIKNIKTPLHPATIGSCHTPGTRADKDQPFLSAPVGTEKR